MRRIFIYLCLIICLIICSCAEERTYQLDTSAISQINLTSGFQTHSIDLGLEESFKFGMWVPVIPSNQKVPLVVALHWASPRTPYRGDAFMKQLVYPALKDLNGIIVAPDVPGETWLDEKSDQILSSFINIIKQKWPIDPDRIVITGYSMGGVGTWYMADKYPKLFCVAIPMASMPVGFLSGKVPHYVIQGSYDEDFGTGPVKTAVKILKSKHRRAELIIADGLSHGGGDILKYIPYLNQSITWFNVDSLSVEHAEKRVPE